MSWLGVARKLGLGLGYLIGSATASAVAIGLGVPALVGLVVGGLVFVELEARRRP